MRRLTFLLVLVAFIFSCGGQWTILQGVAWVNMIRDYSQMVPFPQAVQMTFSGKYPCAICKMIAEKKNADRDKLVALDKQEKKILSPSIVVALPFFAVSLLRYFRRNAGFRTRCDTPPTPPPRVALA